MKKYTLLFFIAVILLIIDNTLMPRIGIGGIIIPSVLFIFCISFSFYTEIGGAIFVGCVSGILQDIFFVDVVGINGLVNLLLCVGVYFIGKNFIKNKLAVPIVLVFFASIIKGLVLMVALKGFGNILYLREVIYIAVYNFAVAVILERIIFRFYNLEAIKDNWRF